MKEREEEEVEEGEEKVDVVDVVVMREKKGEDIFMERDEAGE